MRWFALILSSLAAAMWMFIILVSAIQGLGPLDLESLILTTIILLSTLSVLLAWRREKLGGTLVLASGITHAIFALIVAGHNKLYAASISGGPFILSGILLLLSWRRGRQAGVSSNESPSISPG
jgi:hypothetical protein